MAKRERLTRQPNMRMTFVKAALDGMPAQQLDQVQAYLNQARHKPQVIRNPKLPLPPYYDSPVIDCDHAQVYRDNGRVILALGKATASGEVQPVAHVKLSSKAARAVQGWIREAITADNA